MANTLNYEFSHNIFKNLVLDEFDYMMSLLEEGPNTFELIINQFWKDIKEELKDSEAPEDSEDIIVSSESIDDERILAILDLPSTEKNGDCYLIGFTFAAPGEKMRYFTYEKIMDFYQVGEWISSTEHKLISKHDKYDSKEFIKEIKKCFK